jgi:hypothetical protein
MPLVRLGVAHETDYVVRAVLADGSLIIVSSKDGDNELDSDSPSASNLFSPFGDGITDASLCLGKRFDGQRDFDRRGRDARAG